MAACWLTVRAPPRRISQGSTPVSRRHSTHLVPAEGKWLGAQRPPVQTAPPNAPGGRLSRILRFAQERGIWAVLRPLRPNLEAYAPRICHTMTPVESLRRPLRGAPREGPSSPPGSQPEWSKILTFEKLVTFPGVSLWGVFLKDLELS
jgi:hypothetical protein